MHFCVDQIEVHVHIGTTVEERAETQKLLCTVEFDFDPTQAVETDNIQDTIDYDQIYQQIKHFCQAGEWNLLETLHTELMAELSSRFPKARNLKLKIQKFPWPEANVTVS